MISLALWRGAGGWRGGEEDGWEERSTLRGRGGGVEWMEGGWVTKGGGTLCRMGGGGGDG